MRTISSIEKIAKLRLQSLRKKQSLPKLEPVVRRLKSASGITDHAYQRARQRLGWKKRSLERMLKRAFAQGRRVDDYSGEFGRYLTAKCRGEGVANTLIIYGEIMFFFCNSTLITLYQVPNKFSRYLNSECSISQAA